MKDDPDVRPYLSTLESDADTFEHAAQRLRLYHGRGLFGRWFLSLVIGALNGKAGVLRALAREHRSVEL